MGIKKKASNPMLKGLLKEIKNPYSSIIEDGIVGDNSEFIDTGSYALNAQFSGSIYGGISANKVTAFAGESGVGKTYYVMQAILAFQEKYSDGVCLIYESESAITQKMMKDRGVDISRVAMLPVITIQDFRHQCMKAITVYENDTDKDKPQMMFVLDSLGNLSTAKEIADIEEGNDTRDMTRAQLVRGTFRSLTLKMGLVNIPLVLTNHTYESMSQYTPKQMAGGGGIKYAASTISFLSKAKDKDGTDVIGSIITSTLAKGRLTKEQTKVKTLLNFNTGLDRYYGLLELAEAGGIFKKVKTRFEFPDGSLVFGKHINENPEKYYTKEVLDKIDTYCKSVFLYGNNSDIVDNIVEMDAASEVA